MMVLFQVHAITKSALSYILTLRRRSKIVLGMTVVSVVMDQHAGTVMFDVLDFLYLFVNEPFVIYIPMLFRCSLHELYGGILSRWSRVQICPVRADS